ncbi:hypothetical protein BV898_10364 [Hypsibius exemplaris]|uniref:Uncharacterized protein n=1 Tax=Hypsibius exemplaris TaxID=2072580 RepID=A0A1W0WK00_HYPEX|nr:hypothetical protein BV898_10364 [Hypsibius exemplaris]
MLDVSKAFEEVLHTHVIRSLHSAHLSDALRTLVIDLVTRNTTQLEAVEKVVHSTVKEIVQLPADTPNSFFYASRKFKGLRVMNAEWEGSLQHVNIWFTLEKDGNPLVLAVRNLRAEIDSFIQKLAVPPDEIPPFADAKGKPLNPVAKLREEKRRPEFASWGALKMRGQGVELSPGSKEIESLAHVLGACQKGSLLRNARQDRVEKAIGEALKKTGLEIDYESGCVADNGSRRRTDIVSIDREAEKGFIVDPTIRFEANLSQPHDVDAEKKAIYEPTITFFRDCTGIQDWEVIGLLVGARGTITTVLKMFESASACHRI